MRLRVGRAAVAGGADVRAAMSAVVSKEVATISGKQVILAFRRT
jgi:hypothetical protein